MSQRSIIYGGVIHSVRCMLTTVSQKKSNNIKEICALANKPILSGTEYRVYQQKVLACASILCSKFSQRVKETLRNK